jgi:hypothetical protein
MLTAYYGASAIRVGVLLLCSNVIYVIATPLGSASISFLHGSFRPLLAFGFVTAAIGCGVISTLQPGDSVGKFIGMTVRRRPGIEASSSHSRRRSLTVSATL